MALSLVLSALSAQPQTPSRFGGIRGSAFTTENRQERTFVPGVRLRIERADASVPATAVSTDEIGHFVAAGLPAGTYRITAEFAGMQTVALEVVVQEAKVAEVEIELKPADVKGEVTVSAQAETVDATQTASKAALQQSTLQRAPNLNERLDGLLPLLPGVVRGPDGLINIKGTRTSQAGMLLNSANVTDPVTGSSGINLPIDVVSTAQVVANPYDPEYGKLAGAVASIDTRVSEFDKFHFRVQNFMPRMRKRDGTIMGIESATPRATVTGPLIRGRVAFTQSLEYRYVRTPIETLPPLERDIGVESFDSYTQVDLSPAERQSASITVSLYPQKLSYVGLNTFTPQPSTPDLRQRGYFLAFSHKLISRSGALLASQISFKKFDANLKPHSSEVYKLGVETTTGGFFNRQDRDTGRFEWQEVFTPHALTGRGQHKLKFGLDFVRNSYDGRQAFGPVEILRVSGAAAERTDFLLGVATFIHQQEYTAFVQDSWTIHQRFTLDVGLRADRDSLSDEGHVAPRLGIAVAPFAGQKTVIRGGVGYFYDRINLNIPTFPLLPGRTVTRYVANGTLLGSVVYANRLAGPIDNPRSTAWNVEVQQQAVADLLLRVGYSQRNTVRDFFLEPVTEGDTGVLLLSNTGRNRYREFQVTARYQLRKHVLNGSYVRSSAIGDLNDFNQFFGNNPYAVIRPNERGPATFDAPHRF
ncbi:MAG: TonB-dependent receptor, partial [Bryobacterales bacterium]|nr:TonB-dependent receptor [Bryobacterales bacterium]